VDTDRTSSASIGEGSIQGKTLEVIISELVFVHDHGIVAGPNGPLQRTLANQEEILLRIL
jgi:hypothetical protein